MKRGRGRIRNEKGRCRERDGKVREDWGREAQVMVNGERKT